MATDDKKVHKATLVVLDSQAIWMTSMNKLSKLAVDADDPELRRRINGLLNGMREVGLGRERGNIHNRLRSIVSVWSGEGGSKAAMCQRIVDLFDYCEAAVFSVSPQWEAIAAANGWMPPGGAPSPIRPVKARP